MHSSWAPSPYMNLLHMIKPTVKELAALAHPNTRVQTLRREDDNDLYAVIHAFGELTGFPILVNTSGKGEPIVQDAQRAIRLFRQSPGIAPDSRFYGNSARTDAV